jgi:hypothetical protein
MEQNAPHVSHCSGLPAGNTRNNLPSSLLVSPDFLVVNPVFGKVARPLRIRQRHNQKAGEKIACRSRRNQNDLQESK